MGAYISTTFDSVSRLASPDLCDDETWENTLRNRSSFAVLDHLEVLSTGVDSAPHRPIADAVCEEFPLSACDEPLSPASSTSSLLSDSSSTRRRRLEFAAANDVVFYTIGTPPVEMFGRREMQMSACRDLLNDCRAEPDHLEVVL
jgi:hypothetical protein